MADQARDGLRWQWTGGQASPYSRCCSQWGGCWDIGERPGAPTPSMLSPAGQRLLYFVPFLRLPLTGYCSLHGVVACVRQHKMTSGPITVHLHHLSFLLCWESTYSEAGAKHVPQNSALRITIIASTCSVETIKKGQSSNCSLEVWKSSSSLKKPIVLNTPVSEVSRLQAFSVHTQPCQTTSTVCSDF